MSFFFQPTTPCLQDIYSDLPTLPAGWTDQTTTPPLDTIQLCKVSRAPCTSTQPMVVTHCLTINCDLTWQVNVHGHSLTLTPRSPLSSVPKKLSTESVAALISLLDTCKVCPGHPDEQYKDLVKAKKGKFLSTRQELVAFEDEGFVVELNGKKYMRTIRTRHCDILIHTDKCESCSKFRPTLRAMHSRLLKKTQSPRTPKKFTNNRYLNTPEKLKKLTSLQARAAFLEREKNMLSRKISTSTIPVDTDLSTHLLHMMEEESENIAQRFPEGSFKRIFWDQQLQAARLSDMRQMRWHPVMIRWCLNLKMLSSAAYHAMRTSNFITLPSERTLRDYTHYVQARPGFQDDIDVDLKREARLDELPEWKKYVVVVIDEMKIKESLVYDKHSAHIIGFVNMGDVENQLSQLEQRYGSTNVHVQHPAIATHMLVLMVRGIFFKMEYPYAHFPTRRLTAATLSSIMWQGIERLEFLGFKVLAVTGDGASTNRKFFRMNSYPADGLHYKTLNPYSSGARYLFFISDPPHLLKTTRNCWSHSSLHGSKRKLWVNSLHVYTLCIVYYMYIMTNYRTMDKAFIGAMLLLCTRQKQLRLVVCTFSLN